MKKGKDKDTDLHICRDEVLTFPMVLNERQEEKKKQKWEMRNNSKNKTKVADISLGWLQIYTILLFHSGSLWRTIDTSWNRKAGVYI
jgi:hypothetical protein